MPAVLSVGLLPPDASAIGIDIIPIAAMLAADPAKSRMRVRARPPMQGSGGVEAKKAQYPGFATVISGRRYYDPRLGRFLGRDPKEELAGLNLYAFVHNNPINKWDYLGMEDCGQQDDDGYGSENSWESDLEADIGDLNDAAAEGRRELDALWDRVEEEEKAAQQSASSLPDPNSIAGFNATLGPVGSVYINGAPAPSSVTNGIATNNLVFNSQLGALPSANITPSTTVRVLVWNDDVSKKAGVSAGHVMITDMGGNVILSQFPSGGAATAVINQHDNTTFSPAQTFREENRAPDVVAVITVPDARGFYSAAVNHRMRPDWSPNPSARDETNCAWAAYHALRGGGVKLPVYTDDMMPRTVGADLLNAARNNNNNIIVIQPRQGIR